MILARITMHVVQTFIETDEGLIAEEPRECRSADEAKFEAKMFALNKAGVIAWSKSGDPDSGEWDDDPVILFRDGKTGD